MALQTNLTPSLTNVYCTFIPLTKSFSATLSVTSLHLPPITSFNPLSLSFFFLPSPLSLSYFSLAPTSLPTFLTLLSSSFSHSQPHSLPLFLPHSFQVSLLLCTRVSLFLLQKIPTWKVKPYADTSSSASRSFVRFLKWERAHSHEQAHQSNRENVGRKAREALVRWPNGLSAASFTFEGCTLCDNLTLNRSPVTPRYPCMTTLSGAHGHNGRIQPKQTKGVQNLGKDKRRFACPPTATKFMTLEDRLNYDDSKWNTHWARLGFNSLRSSRQGVLQNKKWPHQLELATLHNKAILPQKSILQSMFRNALCTGCMPISWLQNGVWSGSVAYTVTEGVWSRGVAWTVTPEWNVKPGCGLHPNNDSRHDRSKTGRRSSLMGHQPQRKQNRRLANKGIGHLLNEVWLQRAAMRNITRISVPNRCNRRWWKK